MREISTGRKGLGLAGLLLVIILSIVNGTVGGLPSTRDFNIQCKTQNESVAYCISDPPGCIDSTNKTCTMIGRVTKYNIPCTKHNLLDPYIQVLCRKRHFTYLVSLSRIVSSSTDPREIVTCDKDGHCNPREFIAIAFNEQNTLPADKLFYVCALDALHVTTWNSLGMVQVHKVHAADPGPVPDPRTDPDGYALRIFNESGVGVVWESLQSHHTSGNTRGDFSYACQFVIAVTPEDMRFRKDVKTFVPPPGPIPGPPPGPIPGPIPGPPPGPIPGPIPGAPPGPPPKTNIVNVPIQQNKSLYLEMIQGLVQVELRNKSTGDLKPEKDNVIVSVGVEAGRGTAPLSGVIAKPEEFIQVKSDKAMLLSNLLQTLQPLVLRNTRDQIKKNFAAHKNYSLPTYDLCRRNTALCYMMSPEPTCWTQYSQQCQLLVTFQFSKDKKFVNLRMIVTDWAWGAVALSKDWLMKEDVSFYCVHNRTGAKLIPRINVVHNSYDPDDPALINLPTKVVTSSMESEGRRFCAWRIPTKFAFHMGPNENKTIRYDLLNKQYYVMLATGDKQGHLPTKHLQKKILPDQFSWKLYNEKINNRSNYNSRLNYRLALFELFILIIMACNIK